jgi:5-carboxymethyl-2-hydroxymuconate isomerase
MPHVIVEYTTNLKENGNIKSLLLKINQSLIAAGDIFPIGGIRSRAIELHDYVVADGSNQEDAFVHVTLKIGKGRTEKEKKNACNQVFAAMEQHFAAAFANRFLALSLELVEFTHPTYKKNNIHSRYSNPEG